VIGPLTQLCLDSDGEMRTLALGGTGGEQGVRVLVEATKGARERPVQYNYVQRMVLNVRRVGISYPFFLLGGERIYTHKTMQRQISNFQV
jgi:hypothetical protein